MKILQLCKKFPFPIKDGESIAVTSLSRSLNELGCEVSILAMNTSKHFFELDAVPEALQHYRDIQTVEVDNRIKIWDAFLNLFSKESYHISRFVSPDFRDRLVRMLQEKEFDLIQLETLYLAPYIPDIRRYSNGVISLRAHNVEHEIWDRIAQNTRFWGKKWYLEHLTRKLKRYEIGQFDAYDILVAITQRDLRRFKSLGYRNPAIVTPIGIDPGLYRPDYSSFQRELSISFIGSLDWMPNLEGLQWFLEKVWPAMSRKFPGLTFHIAGRNTPERLLQTRMENVFVHGEVPDAKEFINQHSLMVVPLLSGSGMRAKILEGMALGKVVLTTPLGLEGILAKHKQELLIAETLEGFVKGVEFCYQQKDRLEKIGRRAQDFVFQYYDSLDLAKRLLEAYASRMVEVL